MKNRRDAAAYVIALGLTFAVGVLAGQRCDRSPEQTSVEQPCEPRVVREVRYQCPPPDAGATATVQHPVRDDPAEPSLAAKKSGLPPTPLPHTPQQRKRLLSWVRDQSVDLQGCRGSHRELARPSVTLELDDDGGVRRVRLNAQAGELPPDVASCLRERMVSWSPPAELVANRRELVFLLTL